MSKDKPNGVNFQISNDMLKDYRELKAGKYINSHYDIYKYGHNILKLKKEADNGIHFSSDKDR